MRLLVLTPWWPRDPKDPHGSFVRDQARALRAIGHDVRVGVLRLARPERHLSASEPGALSGPGEPPTAYALGPWWPYRRCYPQLLLTWGRLLARLVLRHGAWARDALLVVHTQDLAVPAHRLTQGIGRPYVIVAHGLEPDSPRYGRPDRLAAYRRALEHAARVLAVGPSLARTLRQEAPRADVRVALNGYAEDVVARVLSAPSEPRVPFRIVSVSNLVEGKGVHLTIEALIARKARGLLVPKYEVVGEGPERPRLEALARDGGLGDLVRFHGRLPREQALALVRGSEAFILPSHPEACGVAYMEAMALGVAPVAVEGEGPSAFVEDGRSGLLVDATVPGVGAALDRVLDVVGEAERLGDGARRAAGALGWEHAAAAFADALPKASARARPIRTWLSLFNEPTPYVVAKLDAVERRGRVRLKRAWLSANASQPWGPDAAHRPEDVLDRPMRVLRAALDLVRGRYAGLHAGGWGGPRATPLLFTAAWLGRRPLAVESDTHMSRSAGAASLARRAYLRLLDRRMRAWLPGGTPQAEHLRRSVSPRAPVVVERMTTDTPTLEAEALRLGPDAGGAWRARTGIPTTARLVLYVGRLAQEKGVPVLLRAVAALLHAGLDVHLALLGPGTLDPAAPELPAERLHTLGRVPWRALVPAYLAADVLALPSGFEPWGLVVNEALLLGCPVVVTDAVGAAPDLVEGPQAGVVVKAGDDASLAAGLRRVLEAGGRASDYARRGRETLRDWTTVGAAARLEAALLGRGVCAC